jgi:hypothetical protein
MAAKDNQVDDDEAATSERRRGPRQRRVIRSFQDQTSQNRIQGPGRCAAYFIVGESETASLP